MSIFFKLYEYVKALIIEHFFSNFSKQVFRLF